MNVEDLIPIKESFIIILDSRNGKINNKSYLSDVLFEFESLIFDDRSISINASVLSFICPNSIYVINEYNNLLVIDHDNMIYNYYIPYGNYNAITFIELLKTILPLNFILTLNTNNNKFILSYSSDFTIKKESNINEIMGFGKNNDYLSSYNSLIFPFTCNFNGLNSFNICLESVNTNNLDSYTLSQSSIIQSINIDNNKSIINFIKTNDYNFKIQIKYIDDIHITIRDNNNNLINFNNQHWNLTLLFNILIDKPRFEYNNSFLNIVNKNK